jgi:hypothetical protein
MSMAAPATPTTVGSASAKISATFPPLSKQNALERLRTLRRREWWSIDGFPINLNLRPLFHMCGHRASESGTKEMIFFGEKIAIKELSWTARRPFKQVSQE